METNRKASLTNELLSWPGVTIQPHRFGGIEFLFEGKEIGHLLGDHLVDLFLSKSKRASERAETHHIYPESGWLSVYLRSEDDVVNAVEILRSKYELMNKEQRYDVKTIS